MRQYILGAILALGAVTPAFASEGGEKAGLPQLRFEDFPPQIFWLAVTFILLLVLLSTLVVPKLQGTIEGRMAKLDGDLAEAGRLKDEAAAAIAAYNQALAEARARANAIAAEAKAKIEAEAAARKAELEAKLAAEAKDAEARIAATKDAALAEVRGIALDAAQAITAKVAGLEVDEASAAAAVDAALARNG
ncbi:F0F1 ATP synthase subunit B' [Zavarzinia compransoris]|uniref:F0F1 ATP synthase subunit B family protein n=1 Tax=Zavarzinia marina TaxID=2911065 RepID=UPI001F3BC541|nr:F0F1 ATP synthase subunit B' [Zavarzinia marina]MCF4165139.1 F0F1 ATP synthase subunit B' [Zavarzinia marina]